MRVDLLIDPGNGFVERIDLPQMELQQKTMMAGHPAAPRLAQVFVHEVAAALGGLVWTMSWRVT